MSWIDVIKILSVLVGIVVTAYGFVRYAFREKEKQHELESKVSTLEERNRLLRSNVANNTIRYDELKDLSTNAQIAVNADLHSISIPVPRDSPTHLKIIISTDPSAEKVLGKEFLTTNGIAGRVFHSQKPEWINKAIEDPKHFALIDKAAGTKTGQGSILTIPLVASGKTKGIIQFMKHPTTGVFTNEDEIIGSRLARPITKLLVDLEDRTEQDMPYATRPDKSYITICFTDINDYSEIAHNMSLHQAVELLNEYYRRMASHAINHHAFIEEYLGDGVYLSFQHESHAEAAIRALKCTMAMQMDFNSLIQEWRAYEYPISDLNYHNIGIASGEVYEGLVGHPLRRKRKLIGKPVDVAAHLVEEGKKHDACILVSEETRNLVVDSEFQFEKLKVDSHSYFKLSEVA